MISDIEYTVPTINEPAGNLNFRVSLPVYYQPGRPSPGEGEGVDITLSAETIGLLGKLKESLILDLNPKV